MNHLNSSQQFASVAIDTPLRRCFDYIIPNTLATSSIQTGMRVKVPFGKRHLIGIILNIKAKSDIAPDRLKPIITVLDAIPVLAPNLLKLLNWASHYYHHPIGEVCHAALPPKLRTAISLSTTTWHITTAGQAAIATLKNAPKQRVLLQLLQQQTEGCQAHQIKHAKIAPQTLKRLIQKGWVQTQEVLLKPPPLTAIQSILHEQPLTLNTDQSVALKRITKQQSFYVALLQGITGSGKTEVYLQAIYPALQRLQQVLILIPEISLSPQTIARFKQRFKVNTVVLHSNLSAQQRLDAWLQAYHGNAQIIIGTRSAVFTPAPNLAMIIIDEEHDTSFKQFEGFKYSARDVAVRRAQLANIPIILGSATPSLESFHNTQTARYAHLTLTHRAGNAAVPQFKLYDIRQQQLKHGFCPQVLQQIEQHLAQQQQVILFLNRRGYAPCLTCHHCGWIAQCHRCDARMTLHRGTTQLRCHHCQTTLKVPSACPQCQQPQLRPLGAGTERIEHHLKDLFPNTPIVRIDSDTTRAQGSLQHKLQTIKAQKACLLVGTQMLAKGHHFPKVTLVVILDADSGLYSIDFRAQEHTAQLLLQVAGRSGRANQAGEVAIQTRHPQHPLLKHILQQDYNAAAHHCLQERKQCQLPPFSHLVIIRAQAPELDIALSFLKQVRSNALNLLLSNNTVSLLGPIPAQMAKRVGSYHAQLVLQSTQRLALHQLITKLLLKMESIKRRTRVRWSLDIDPLDTL